MPCYQVVVNTVAFESAKGHEDILADAMREAGYRVSRYGDMIQFSRGGVSGSYRAGRFYTQGEDFDVDEIKRSFSGQIMKHAARKFGWTKTGTTKGQIRKRI